MPARRLPWFKLWPEAMRHEKVVLLSDSAFRTWVVTLAAGSEQSTRWRFASVKHLMSVTGRPEADIHELIGMKLLDVTAGSGEVWVHDWRQWQDRFASDLAPRIGGDHSANTPRTLRNGSANIPAKLPGELRGEKGEERGETETPTPQPPSPQAGPGERRNPGQRRRGGAGGWATTAAPPPEVPPLVPLVETDRQLWAAALADVTAGLLPANVENFAALEPLGRAPDGGLRLRAPPGGMHLGPSRAAIARALLDAGDPAGRHVVIVEA